MVERVERSRLVLRGRLSAHGRGHASSNPSILLWYIDTVVQ